MGDRPRRALVAYGDTEDVSTFAGIPFFLLQAGRCVGVLDSGVALHPETFRAERILWNALRPLRLDRPRGFQYSHRHLERLWSSRSETAAVELVSHYPLLPPAAVETRPTSFYLDATLGLYFDHYEYPIGRRIRAEALAREREAYAAARFVFCMSRWCADDVERCGVPSERVRVVAPGANLDERLLVPAPPWSGELNPLRIGLVGEDWERKGGPLLLEVADRLARMGIAVEVVIVGIDARSLPSHPALSAVGFVDKRVDLARFVELLRSFHFGCLLSTAEAFGIAIVESLRLGVPVIGRDIGGLAEAVPADAGILFPADGTAELLAEELALLVREPERYAALRAAAERRAETHSWDRAARELGEALDG